jgi:hypothetical protein
MLHRKLRVIAKLVFQKHNEKLHVRVAALPSGRLFACRGTSQERYVQVAG